MNLMNREKGTIKAEQQEDKGDVNHSASQTLHQNTVLAMSNLLNANIDTGLMYAIGKKRETRKTVVFKGAFQSKTASKSKTVESVKLLQYTF